MSAINLTLPQARAIAAMHRMPLKPVGTGSGRADRRTTKIVFAAGTIESLRKLGLARNIMSGGRLVSYNLTAKGFAAAERQLGLCIGCGCTNDRACAGGCHWVEPDICSACAGRRP